MATAQLSDKLVTYVQDAHAMERNSLMALQSMLQHTEDPEMRQMLEHHAKETERHEQRIAKRLEEIGADTSATREAGVLVGSAFKGVMDQLRSEKPARDARDGYMTEQLEISAYEMLVRLARRAGDEQTAHIAEENLKDEYAMAEKISSSWDKVIDLTLKEEGIV